MVQKILGDCIHCACLAGLVIYCFENLLPTVHAKHLCVRQTVIQALNHSYISNAYSDNVGMETL